MRRSSPLLLLLVTGPMGALMFALGVRAMWASHARASWPATRGLMRAAEIHEVRDRGGHRFVPHVSYAYRVDERAYDGSELSFEDVDEPTRDAVVRRLAAFPIGDSIDVHYDPAHPERSALDVGHGLDGIALAVIGTLMLGFAALVYRFTRGRRAPFPA